MKSTRPITEGNIHTNIRTPSMSSFKAWIRTLSTLSTSFSYRDHRALAPLSKSWRESWDSSGGRLESSFRDGMFIPTSSIGSLNCIKPLLIRDTHHPRYIHCVVPELVPQTLRFYPTRLAEPSAVGKIKTKRLQSSPSSGPRSRSSGFTALDITISGRGDTKGEKATSLVACACSF